MDWIALILCPLSIVFCIIAASKSAWMERESREHRRVASAAAWRARSFAYAAGRDAESVRTIAGRMTGEPK